MLIPILGVHPSKLESIIAERFPKYRVKQLLQWLYTHFTTDLKQMKNLPVDFKEYLQSTFSFDIPLVDSNVVSKDGSAKFRLKLKDGHIIESVLIPDAKKNTLCVSSQVGCSRKCSFCATGKMGLIRNLSVDEIVAQIVIAELECKLFANESPLNASIRVTRVTNLVFMGMGEPLDNLDNVLEALRIIQSDATLAFSPRRTTVSTCGVVPGIISFADSGVRAKLAISLNSAIDEKRNSLMPINRKYPLHELKQASLYYLRKTNFRITYEYVLLPEHNMGKADLIALRKFVGDLSCKINFIPYNPGPGSTIGSPTSKQVDDFMQMAQSLPQAIMLRKSRGADVFGACGQLSNNNVEKL